MPEAAAERCGAPATPARRPFRRAGEEARRTDLIEATLALIAEGGHEAATVRAIAARAGVTPGLIRHYFARKEDLVAAAHEALMTGLTEAAAARLDDLPRDPRARLAGFVAASVSPPVADPRVMALWAAAMQLVPRDSAMRRVHAVTYLAFRDRLEGLIAEALRAAGRPADPPTLRAHAVAGNALIDGLWLEASALPELMAGMDLPALALSAFSRLLDLPLED